MKLKFLFNKFAEHIPLGKKPTVVVEIGTDLLKIAQMHKGKNGQIDYQKLKIFRLADLKGSLNEELISIFGSMHIEPQAVTTYLPRKLITTHFVEIPSTDDDELREIMRLQGIKQTPYSPDEVAMDYAVVGSRMEGMSDVVLVFCQRKFVDERVQLLQECGFRVKQIGISTEGVIDWYAAYHAANGLTVTKDLMVLIDQDFTSSDVIFCRNGEMVYSKSILVGAQQLHLDAMQSEDAIERFCNDVQQAIDFAREEAKFESPKKAALIAPFVDGKPLRQALESKLQMLVESYDPTRDLNLPKDSQAHLGSVTALFGFGHEKEPLQFNIMPDDLKLSISLEKRNRQMVATALLSLGVFALLIFLMASQFYKRKSYLDLLDKEIAKTEDYAKGIEKKLSQTHVIEKAKDPNSSILNYLSKISSVLPTNVYFTSVDFSADDKIVLKGYAKQMSEVFDYTKSLEDLKIFKGVKADRVSKKREDDQVVAEFTINCML